MEQSVFHHFALPERLPDSEDANLNEVEARLTDHLLVAVRIMRDYAAGDELRSDVSSIWERLRQCLVVSKAVTRDGRVDRTRLLSELRGMNALSAILLDIRSQNAALLIHRLSDSAEEVVFEVFETSPRSEDVLAADNALQWDFPGSAFAIALPTFNDDNFQGALADFLELASLESTKAFGAQSLKAGVHTYEDRDTGDPAIISSLLMAVIEENGRRLSTPPIRKRVRDDVCWFKARRPWRRSPRWLALRVLISRYLLLGLGAELGRFEYKFCVCVCLAKFLEGAQPFLEVDQVHFLKIKLCRRLAKLDMERDCVQEQHLMRKVDLLFLRLTPIIDPIIQSAVGHVLSVWRAWQQSSIKHIPPLPRRAAMSDMRLPLRISGQWLQGILLSSNRMMKSRQQKWIPPSNFDPSALRNEHFAELVKPLLQITATENKVRESLQSAFGSGAFDTAPAQIKSLIDEGLPLYRGNASEMSLLILDAMEFWTRLDLWTCQQFPLLQKYHPVFTPEILDVLHLELYKDMVRLQTIQNYLEVRIRMCRGSKVTVFDDPTNDCFARRYYDEVPSVESLVDLREDIEMTASYRKQLKLEEWRRKNAEYNDLTRQVNGSTCILTVDDNDLYGRGEHIENLCPRCQAIRRLARLRIQIHEHPLPSDDFLAKVVVFELRCPPAFAVYRDTTWMILSRLAFPAPAQGVEPKCRVHEYSAFANFADNTAQPSFSLASVTKPFLNTHYANATFPVEWEGGWDAVCKPNGLKFAYFDATSRIWTGRTRLRPQFAHHVQLQLPQNSPFRGLVHHKGFAAEGDGPSSYEIMATQMSCPSGLNSHEFLAFKTLMSGTARRWISILVELGATNMNWSSEASAILLNHLVLHCGPASDQNDELKPLRLIHSVFRDAHFVEKLLDQLDSRLSNLAAVASWREAYLMGTIITLVLRIFDLAAAANLGTDLHEKALGSVLQAREICVRWFRLLREEILTSPDRAAAKQLQQRALAAALLCRRTFVIHLEHSVPFDPISLATYVESTIATHENMVSNIYSLPKTMLQDMVSTTKLSHRLKRLVSRSICDSPDSLRDALKQFWPDADRIESANTKITLDGAGWLSCGIAETETESQQVVNVDLLLGTLLVNGKPVGKLPQDSQNSVMLRALFGEQPLRVFQSSVPGMTYTLSNRPNGFTVHIGYEGRDTIIIAKSRGPPACTVRFVPRECFYSGNTWDLPGPLVDGRMHWLDLRTGDVYMAPTASPWDIFNHHGIWTMNIYEPICWRLRHGRQGQETVVDPLSPLFQRVARILDGLTNRRSLLVTQPSISSAGLEVQIQRLQLMFFVNKSQRLYSPQLMLEIDPNQDAGTWYGLTSKLVCCNVDNPLCRTVLVPLGHLSTTRLGCHVMVSIEEEGRYGRFLINDTLGRIDCAAEPSLVYTKALLHAYTSFLLPDPLTGRTGTEESLDWLRLGICRPWTVLSERLVPVLSQIASLTPVREYYPRDLKVMKTDRWDDQLTCHIQHPMYRQVVEEIRAVSRDLEIFNTTQGPSQRTCRKPSPPDEARLTERALIRRRLYERKGAGEDGGSPTSKNRDRLYLSRDKPSPSESRYAAVMEITHLLRKKPPSFKTPSNLANLLSQGNTIGGYGAEYEAVSLSGQMRADIRENWGSLVESCRSRSSYSLMFFLATLAFRQNFDDGLLKGLLAFAIFGDLQSLPLPPWPSYFNFRPDSNPGLDDITKLIHPFKAQAPEDDGEGLGMLITAKQRRKMQVAKDVHEMKCDEDSRYLAKFLLAQWPCREPDLLEFPRTDLRVDITAALQAVRPEWLRLYYNRNLSLHLNQVQLILNRHRSDWEYKPPLVMASKVVLGSPNPHRGAVIPGLDSDLLGKAFNRTSLIAPARRNSALEWTPLASNSQYGHPSSVPMRNNRPIASNAKPRVSPAEARGHIHELQEIVDDLAKSKSLVRKTYAGDLLQSLKAFKNLRTPQQLPTFLSLRDDAAATSEFIRAFLSLKSSLETPRPSMSSRRIRWLQLGGLWPAITTVSLLEQLRSTANPCFGVGMRDALITFGLAITKLQRVVRLNDCVHARDTSRFQDEEANLGHTNWRPQDHPDWLLLEIDSNLLIRPSQVDVALATISPPSGTNSVLQMNMGQGKTSCIIPMVAVAMADKKSLVRIIVPKALLQQTAQLLHSRLGRIVNRHVGHIPFSRRTATKDDSIRLYYEIHKRAMKAGGLMLCLPEHNLSFLLSGQQRILDNKFNEAKPMIKVNSWLRSVCRDILDESDYTLAARTQLIYPSGPQMPVDGHPHRWHVVQALLSLVDQHLYSLQSSFPQSIEVVRRQGGGFPLIYFARQDVEDELLKRLAADITKGHGSILPVSTFDNRERAAVRDFLAPGTQKLKPTTLDKIRNLRADRPQVRQTVYLVRGLIVNRILIMTLKKRWNVQYGLRPNSDPVAVPYHAKGVPSEQSEWGHPDVAILFTCLVFYYGGIDESQLQLALTRVLKSDDPSTEYDKWVQSSEEFPASIRAWNTINIEDDAQVRDIWKAVRYRVIVVDYFLNNFVFPQHAKQFRVKLQSSGWDIPLFSAQPASPSAGTMNGSTEDQLSKQPRQQPLTTGFSGTNDNRTMLPLTIQQADLTTLSHTNAEVLTYLLHSRSRRCHIMTNPRGGRATERDLLFMLKGQNIRILIDAGAQILEMDNKTLVKTWLEVDQRCEAALYFDSTNKPCVITKHGRETPLLTSPYADDLSKCFVYLDEAHTRGTDLKFPLDARGALTVGQGQSKDHTVQAAMRLRQLGTTQAITFFIPPEVRQVIADLRPKSKFDTIDSHDVICWLLDNSCDSIEQLQPLYYSQGLDFCRRTQAALDNPDYLTNPDHRARYVSSIRQNELQTLQDMYEPKVKGAKHGNFQSSHPKVAAFAEELNIRRKGFQDTGRAVHGSALQEVEQEREVAFEVESVRQVKKQVQYDALRFPGLHPDVEVFARTGRLPVDSHAVAHVFQLLSSTALGRKHKVSGRGSHAQSKLFVSGEFNRTVKLYTSSAPDNLLRPVSWVLWSGLFETAVVLVPEEAEQVIRMMYAKATHSKVHLITYASPVTKRMMAFNNLVFFSMPPLPEGWAAPQWLKTELGLLAGRLYFQWHEYESLCKFLGVAEDDKSMASLPLETDDEEDIRDSEESNDDMEEAQPRGKTITSARGKKQTIKTSFSPRPLTFLQEWLAIRRHGQDFIQTPMGFMTQGKALQASHPFFSEGIAASVPVAPVGAALAGTTGGLGAGSLWGPNENGYVEEVVEFDGVDDMGANVGNVGGDEKEEEVVYDDSEWFNSDLPESEVVSED